MTTGEKNIKKIEKKITRGRGRGRGEKGEGGGGREGGEGEKERGERGGGSYCELYMLLLIHTHKSILTKNCLYYNLSPMSLRSMILGSVNSSMAYRSPSLPSPESFTPPYYEKRRGEKKRDGISEME